MNPDNEGAYEVTTTRCYVCVAQAAKAKTFQGADSIGLYVSSRLRGGSRD